MFQLQIEAGSGEGPGPPNNNAEGAVASPPRDDNHNAAQPEHRVTQLTPSGKRFLFFIQKWCGFNITLTYEYELMYV